MNIIEKFALHFLRNNTFIDFLIFFSSYHPFILKKILNLFYGDILK
jgi:hypothetical protein